MNGTTFSPDTATAPTFDTRLTLGAELVTRLLAAPQAIADAQKAYDEAHVAYETCKAGVVIQAFSAPLFPGKKEGEPNRAAGNEEERAAAVAKTLAENITLKPLASGRDEALRKLSLARNEFEALKLVVQALSR